MGDVIGKVAVVTGAASGIGAATARLLAARGAAVVVADLNAAGAADVAAAITKQGGRGVAVEVDVRDEQQVAEMVRTATREFGGLHLLHNNAALQTPDVMGRDGAITDADPQLWAEVLRVNLIGYLLAAKHAVPAMITSGGGVVVNAASGTGVLAELSRPAYGTSKAAIIAFTRNLATQYGGQGIRAVAVVLGLVATEGLKANLPPEAQAGLLRHQLIPRLTEPQDVAEVVAFLASDAARAITGTSITVDGGFLAHTPTYADEMAMIR